MAAERSVTPQTLGAWVIKCNPGRTPVDAMRRSGRADARWCVAANYRSQLMRPGQRVLFWVSAHRLRGFWGAGRITGSPSTVDGRLSVAVRIPLFAEPLTAVEVSRCSALRSLEVFRSPQQSNPSWVSTDEWAVLEPLLPQLGIPGEQAKLEAT
ncbi:EVE domain-containing protein [Mycolicibacterium gilvum]|uniref:Uncharacterized protein n=1 Tax=Mycolicibacterium gilvum (strain DSM 45189 / LMG 24558 / Spyr1) TaxID=278137 RepID=E6TPG9_MYCSR|nr:EVE domain-containing protein [Mycolicibacterium gilvum]ADU01719.1 hypothetical protein Mspyr1_51920 [Mycolicibacterium gilvum Spyr1]